MAVYYWFDRPFTIQNTFPYRLADNSIATYVTEHNCENDGNAQNVSWSDAGVAYPSLSDIDNITGYLLPLWWQKANIVRGTFPQTALGGQNAEVSW